MNLGHTLVHWVGSWVWHDLTWFDTRTNIISRPLHLRMSLTFPDSITDQFKVGKSWKIWTMHGLTILTPFHADTAPGAHHEQFGRRWCVSSRVWTRRRLGSVLHVVPLCMLQLLSRFTQGFLDLTDKELETEALPTFPWCQFVSQCISVWTHLHLFGIQSMVMIRIGWEWLLPQIRVSCF